MGTASHSDMLPIWTDRQVQQICDVRDGQPFPRFVQFNDHPEQLELVSTFIGLDQRNGYQTPRQSYVDACLAGIRVAEALDTQVHAGWIKFFVCQVDRNNSLMWDQYRGPEEVVSAVAEWIVTFIERHGWGPDGASTALGQRHSNAMIVAAESGAVFTEHRDGSTARQLAGVLAPSSVATFGDVQGSLVRPREGADGAALTSVDGTDGELQPGATGSVDETSRLVALAETAMMVGDQSLALELYEEAARRGEVQAMYECGRLYASNGDRGSASFWFGVAADGGDPRGFAWLAQLAEREGDAQGEREWSRKGAEAGEAWCMGNYAYFLLVEAQQDMQRGIAGEDLQAMLQECYRFAVRAAEQGLSSAMYCAGLASVILNRVDEGRKWLIQAENNGHPTARSMIERLGL